MDNTIQIVRDLLTGLSNGEVGEQLAAYYHSDVIQTELPNALNPTGGKSDLKTIMHRSKQGTQMLSKQSYTIKSELMSQDGMIAVEALWQGTLAVPVAGLQAGEIMTGHFAMFFTFANGKILTQTNYDCFEPFTKG